MLRIISRYSGSVANLRRDLTYAPMSPVRINGSIKSPRDVRVVNPSSVTAFTPRNHFEALRIENVPCTPSIGRRIAEFINPCACCKFLFDGTSIRPFVSPNALAIAAALFLKLLRKTSASGLSFS